MAKFHVTYEIVTPESVENGEAEEGGFVQPGGWHTEDSEGMSLREAVDLVDAGVMEDAGSWFVEVDVRVDYRTAAEERRSLHPPRNITPSSYARLRRLLVFRSN